MRPARWIGLVAAALVLVGLRRRRRAERRPVGRPTAVPTGLGLAPVHATVDEQRRAYDQMLARGVDAFFDARRADCPVCSSTDLSVKVRTRDLHQNKPGEFVLEQCTACGHIFQNPRLSLEGFEFYYRDFYDRTGERVTDLGFGVGRDASERRARMLHGHGEPKRWLDLGAGHEHFCAVAREVWPDTIFDGFDLGDSRESADGGTSVDRHRGMRAESGEERVAPYDVVSMHHYLEHTRDPFEEIEAAARVLAEGGYLLVEVPDPSSTFGRVLGRHGMPWFGPQHQHLLSIENLEWVLGERGFTPLAQDRGEAHQPVDLVLAVSMAINRLAPPTDLPWRAPTTRRARVRRAVVSTAGVPFLAVAFALDQVAAVVIRRSQRSNTYRVLSRRDHSTLTPTDTVVIDLRDPVAVS